MGSSQDDNMNQFKDKDENNGGQESLTNLNPEVKAVGPEDKKKRLKFDLAMTTLSKKLNSKGY